MDKVSLLAKVREVLGKKVKKYRREGLIPAHVFGKNLATEHLFVKLSEFMTVYGKAGETHLIDLKVDDQEARPVLVRDLQVDPVTSHPRHIDFYQVNLQEKVVVSVPIELKGEEPELVHTKEAIVIHPLASVEVEALPQSLPEKIEVDVSQLRTFDDVVLVKDLPISAGVTVLTDPEALVAKLDRAVSAETEKILAEQAAEAQAATEAVAAEAAAEGVQEAPASAAPEGEKVEEKIGEEPHSTEASRGKEEAEGKKEQ